MSVLSSSCIAKFLLIRGINVNLKDLLCLSSFLIFGISPTCGVMYCPPVSRGKQVSLMGMETEKITQSDIVCANLHMEKKNLFW